MTLDDLRYSSEAFGCASEVATRRIQQQQSTWRRRLARPPFAPAASCWASIVLVFIMPVLPCLQFPIYFSFLLVITNLFLKPLSLESHFQKVLFVFCFCDIDE